jgi:hypothetical protein
MHICIHYYSFCILVYFARTLTAILIHFSKCGYGHSSTFYEKHISSVVQLIASR